MKTLIIGGSGFLGSKIVESLNGNCQSTYYRNQLFPNQICLDLENPRSVTDCLIQSKPEMILHCGGLTETDFCEANQELANRINCFGMETLLKNFDGKMVYFSTDYVFDGKHAPYNENSEPNPINHYGQTKLLAEKKVLENRDNLVIRVSGLYGINRPNNKFLKKLQKSGPISASRDLVSTPTYIEDIINNLPDLISISGLVHFSGEESISRYDFLDKAMKILGLDTKILQEYEASLTRRPRDSSLASIYTFRKTKLDNALEEMRRRL